MAKKICVDRHLAYGIHFKDIDLADLVNAEPRLTDVMMFDYIKNV